MPNLKIVDMTGKEVGTIELSDAVFAAEPNQAVLHAAVRSYLLNQRQGTQSTKTRSEVSGGGKKPWRQKGSGRARQGSTRSPQWTHGGIALGPKPRSYRVDMNKKTKRVAIISALSAKVAANEIIVVDKITTEDYKTKTMVNLLAAIGAGKKSLVVLSENDKRVVKSFDNIPGVKTTPSTIISVYDLINCDTVVADQNAIKTIEEVYA